MLGRLILLCLVCLMYAQVPDVARAQDASEAAVLDVPASEEDPPSINDIQIKPRQTEEIIRLRELYRDQVERYRILERDFQVNKNQYFQLQTLQSLEKAVVSTREVMIIRAEVLITYFELMRASLEDTEGIDLVQKKEVIDTLISHIEVLREHKKALEQTVSREGIAQRVYEFSSISVSFESTAYRALALITIGDIQTVYDKARILYDEVLLYHEQYPVSQVKQQERNRAYREAKRELDRVELLLRDIRASYNSAQGLRRDSYDRELGNNLDGAYSGTRQILFYLRELFLELT